MDASNLLKPALAQGGTICAASARPPTRNSAALREGPRAGPPVPEDRRQRADHRGHDQDPEGPEALLRGASQGRYTRRDQGRGRAVGALHQRPQAARQGDRRDRRGRRRADAGARSKRKKVIGVKEIEASSPRWPASRPSPSRRRRSRRCCAPRSDLKRVVFGQDKAIEALSSAIKLAAPACASRKSRSATTCSPAPPASARPRWPSSLATRWASSCCASTCRNTWSATRSRRLIGAPPGYVGFDQGGLLTDASTSIRTACCCSTRSRRRIRMSTTSCCR
jgi:ATP-dependent Clp protease ATP-binding subunit ClpA